MQTNAEKLYKLPVCAFGSLVGILGQVELLVYSYFYVFNIEKSRIFCCELVFDCDDAATQCIANQFCLGV